MKEAFFNHQAQTSPHPLGLEISRASGSYIYDSEGKSYLDLVAGVSACGLGHSPDAVIHAVEKQLKKYLHVMVYGEFILEEPAAYAKELAENLPANLNCTYLVNSGTEAMEGALKLARRVTGRSEIFAAKDAYHGNTLGSLSLMDYEERKAPFRPLLSQIHHLRFNHKADLDQISDKTAAVVLETIQGGAGFILPKKGYLQAVHEKCRQVGALLILDEIQPGFGRTGKLFAFEHYGVVPDILVIGKAMASGLPVGAFVSSREYMSQLANNPMLGHITTFGGNPVIAAACRATLKEVTSGNLIPATLEKESLFRKQLIHPAIQEIRGKGLMLALIMKNETQAHHLVKRCLEKGLVLFWLLFEKRAVRISPPLTISEAEIHQACGIIIEALDELAN